ncbi:carbohydrate esterase family 1 protein [Ceratobasidium sp. AG-Ba]|nr:carbohydrate esterase family 1 protein [Ceratobasidium sp. AG-Ba]QRW02270.1 carbohydrate esterase family 1 protein [Ceratobasidium sp. AG-Ba]
MRSTIIALVSFAALARGVAGVAVWGQCGGIGYSGSTVCDAGTTCVHVNDYYYQCQPGSGGGGGTTPTSTTKAGSTPTGSVNIPKGTLAPISNFGSNPTNVKLYAYVPNSVKSNPAMLVALHYCQGSAQALYSGTSFKQYADQYGFVVMYPSAPDSGGCWDVHTNATFTHNAGGDSLGIASGIRYLTSALNVNPARVVAVGMSSGAMMTNVLAGAYPDLIKAASVCSGVPYGCFAGSGLWSVQCAHGELVKTPQQWGDLVRSGYKGYTGSRPKMQLWHGSADTTLYPQNFQEEVKQWTNVFGVSQTPTATTQNYLQSGWTKTDYGSNVQGIYGAGQGHGMPVQYPQIMAWLGLNQ